METSTSDERPQPAGLDASLTPAMRQYRAAKEANPDALLFFRMGDFYELFFEDAVVASRELQLTLTARDKARSVPMCGVPYHAAENYLRRLLRRGFKVAICEQMEDPKLAKGVVRREVTRILTPGTALDPSLDAGQSCWLAAVCTFPGKNVSCVGLSMIDLSTGEFRATEFSGSQGWNAAIDELTRLRPMEILFSDDLAPAKGSESLSLQLQQPPLDRRFDPFSGIDTVKTKTALESWVFQVQHGLPLLKKYLGVHSVEGLGLAGRPAALIAAGAVIEYLKRTKQGTLAHLDGLRFYERSTCLEMDAVTVRNLELIDPLFTAEGTDTTLLWAIDACLTPMGKRLLRSTLLRPAKGVEEINLRLDAVAELVADLRKRAELRRALDGMLDLERLLGRIALDSAGPRDVMAMSRILSCMPQILAAMSSFQAQRWRALWENFDRLDDVHHEIARTLADEPPLNIGDGGAIRDGVSAELDELRDLGQSGRRAVAAIEERERDRTGIGSLKVRYNNVFGYYLEVTRANAHAVPTDYERKQTLVNAERFTTPELKELESKILHAQDRCGEIERTIFAELKATVLAAAGRLRNTARKLAEIDLLGAYAEQAARFGWVRPEIDESLVLEIVGGRHPVVERRMEEQGDGRFVPNSLFLQGAIDNQAGPSIGLITGPNMGGKSTYLRMAALLTIMAQAGSFVPAERLRLGVIDRIFTRIGASDNVARGRSTFMVEMTETAAILNSATDRSLVLMDEMGRGTATYDGLSLAWAVVEHMHNVVGARTLFATHYHELTLLSDGLKRLHNLRVTAKESGGGIVFLHTVESGAASKSYGIEVARLAGLPSKVIERAREVLRTHERAEAGQIRDAGVLPALQMTMFTPLSQKIVDRLSAVNLDEMTPRDALNLLAELQQELLS